MTRSYSRRYSSVQNSMKRRLGSDELGLRLSSWTETLDGKSSQMTGKEKRDWAILKKEERRDLGLVDGLRFETEEDSAEYLRKREEEAAAARPDRRGQAPKKRTSFAEKAEFKDRDPDFEKQKEMVAAMSRQKAQRMVDALKKKYGGAKWPKDVCRLYRLLMHKALLVEA